MAVPKGPPLMFGNGVRSAYVLPAGLAAMLYTDLKQGPLCCIRTPPETAILVPYTPVLSYHPSH